jgi:hypothetical protein
MMERGAYPYRATDNSGLHNGVVVGQIWESLKPSDICNKIAQGEEGYRIVNIQEPYAYLSLPTTNMMRRVMAYFVLAVQIKHGERSQAQAHTMKGRACTAMVVENAIKARMLLATLIYLIFGRR